MAAQPAWSTSARLVPDIAEDIKYAGSDNFVGRPVDGYAAAKCYLQQPAAAALARVEHEPARAAPPPEDSGTAIAPRAPWPTSCAGRTTWATSAPSRGTTRAWTSRSCSATTSRRSPATAAAAPLDLTLMQCDGHDTPLPATGHGHGFRFLRPAREHRQPGHHPGATRQPPAPAARRWRARASATTRWSGGTTPSSPNPPRTRCTTCRCNRHAPVGAASAAMQRAINGIAAEAAPTDSASR